MTVTKSAMTFSALAFALLFGGGVYLMMNLSTFAKPVTEKIASQALGVKVSIGAMDIKLQEKSATVSNIRIANPPGYSNPHAITIQTVNVALDTVAENLITFKDINVTGTQVNLEVQKDGTNLTALQKNIQSRQKQQSKENPIKVIIKRFTLQKAQLNPSITLLNNQKLQPVTIPTVTLRGIGQRENGVLAEEAVAQIMQNVITTASKSANNAGFYQGLSPEALRELGVSQIETLKNKVSEDLNELGDKLKGIFE